MNRRSILSLSAIGAFAFALLAGPAASQQKSLKGQLTGAWTLVSVTNTDKNGTKRMNFGPNPKGILILDASGHYAQTQLRADVPKFKAATRMKGTAEEYKAAGQGSLATFGTWSLDEGNKTLTFHIVGSTFPNQEGGDSKRNVALNGDELTMTVLAAAAGGRSEAVYRRAK